MKLILTSLVLIGAVGLLVEAQTQGRRIGPGGQRRLGGRNRGGRGRGGRGRGGGRRRTTTQAPQPCPPIPHIDNGQGLDTGDTVRYACEPGYVLEGTNVITCVNGRWTVAPRCTRQLCPKPPNVPFSNEPTLSNGGVTATYTCLAGYRVIGGNGATSRTVNCNTQSQFWPNLPSCEPIPVISCSGPPSILNALSTVSGNTATYTCVAGYRLRAGTPSSIQCSGGIWPSTNLPVCEVDPNAPQPIKCTKAPPCGDAVTTREPAGDSYAVGESVKYTCATGHRIVGSNNNLNNSASVFCTSSGTWTTTPTCEPVNCGVPPAGTNTVPVVANSIVYPNTYTYVCNTNYESGTSLESKCLADGTWSLTPAPTCTQKMCRASALPTLANADVVQRDVPIGSTVDFTCRLDYRLAPSSGTPTRVVSTTCQADGSFTAITSKCVFTRPESCRDYYERDNLFAAAAISCVDIVIDPQGPGIGDPNNPDPFSVQCCKTSATDYCTQVLPSAGGGLTPAATPCTGATTIAMSTGNAALDTTFNTPISHVCGTPSTVTYPISNTQIVSMIESTSGTCSQQTTVGCTVAANSLSLALRVNGKSSGQLYGTAIFDRTAAPAQIDLTNYVYTNAICDCAVTGTPQSTGAAGAACSSGCACTTVGAVANPASDTITKYLTPQNPEYVTNYQITVHNSIPTLAAGAFNINVGAIKCCEKF